MTGGALSLLLLKKTEFLLQPVNLGVGNVTHKCAAFLFQLWCLFMNFASLVNVLATFGSVTTDLGVESGISDYTSRDAEELLPDWIDIGVLRKDVDECEAASHVGCSLQSDVDDDSEGNVGCGVSSALQADVDSTSEPEQDSQSIPRSSGETNSVPMQPSTDIHGNNVEATNVHGNNKGDSQFLHSIFSNYLMPLGMPVAGACHLLASVGKESVEGLAHWDVFWKQLKTLDALIMEKSRWDKVLGTHCLEEADKKLLQGVKQVRLYHARWNMVYIFLDAIAPIMSTLRRVWSANLFDHGSAEEDRLNLEDGFRPSHVTEILSDRCFSVYMSLVFLVQSIPKHLVSWLEGCSCHEFDGETRRQRGARIKREFDGKTTFCPFSGCRACQCACGAIHAKAKTLMLTAREKLQAKITLRLLSPAQSRTAMQDAHVALERMLELILLKFNFWTVLPWKLCGLAHWNLDVARTCARECVAQFFTVALDAASTVHHRISLYFLHPDGPLSKDINAFISGLPMSGELILAVMMLRIISVVERTIEKEHVNPNRKMRGKRIDRGAAISCVSRLPWIKKCMADPMMLEHLLVVFERSRTAKWLASELGFGRHPQVIACGDPRQEARHSAMWDVMQRLVYRQNPEDLFANMQEQHSFHERGQASTKRKADQMLGKVKRKSIKKTAAEYIKTKLAMAHLQQRLDTSTVYVFPRHILSLIPVSHALSGDHAEWTGDGLPAETSEIFVRLLDGGAGRKKTLKLPHAARMHALLATDVTLTLHSLMPASTEDAPMLALEAMDLNPSHMGRSFVLNGFKCDFDELCTRSRQWKIADDLAYVFKNVDLPASQNKAICGSLIDARAFPGADICLHTPEAWKPAVLAIAETGYLSILDATEPCLDCQMTTAGLEHLEYGEILTGARDVFEVPPNIPLEGLTALECVLALEAEGFAWAALPVVKRRADLWYSCDSAKLWYSTPAEVPTNYLRCLLAARSLQQRGVERFPHWVPRSTEAFYLSILQDGAVPAIPTVNSKLALQMDVDDENPAPLPIEFLSGEGGEDEELTLELIEQALFSVEPTARSAPALTDGSQRAPSIFQVAANGQLSMPRHGFVSWGPFSLKYTVSKNGSADIEARCRFHKLSKSSGCKRRVAVSGSAEQEDSAIRALLHWCNRACDPGIDRQRHHIVVPLPLHAPPFFELLKRQQITAPIPTPIFSDAQLDASAADAAAVP